MEGRRETTDTFFDPVSNFSNFGASRGFGSQRSMLSNVFGIRDPFDDPFFTRPFGSMLGFNSFSHCEPSSDSRRENAPKPILIEEIDSDDEKEGEKEVDVNEAKKEDTEKCPMSSPLPYIEHPDDNSDVSKIKHVQYENGHNQVERAQPHNSISFKKVTFGGVNGTYYSASTTRKAGTDGVVLEESREADKTTGLAAHRVSRGINDKGHSVTRKLGSDGKVDTVQTLYNLEKDELTGFEESWKDNAQKQFPGWNEGSLMDGNPGSSNGRQETWAGQALPSIVRFGGAGVRPVHDPNSNSSVGRPKKVVRIQIE